MTADNLAGVTLANRYYLREHVGSGGMSDVYQVWDNVRSARMAVKILRRDLANTPQVFKMFSKEAELLRTLQHPNIVRLYEFERHDEIVFIVMEWVDGCSLNQYLSGQKKPLSLEEISHILQPVCSALFYAHQKKVFHCDVKPANILIREDGPVLLTDFGVARFTSEEVGGGTPTYMAPEQFTCGRIDARTDIYSLGVTLYEMLSGGHLPYRGDTPDSQGTTLRERIAWEHLHKPLPDLNEFNKSVPRDVVAVVSTALNMNLINRFPSTNSLREAYEHARMRDGGSERDDRTVLKLPPDDKREKQPPDSSTRRSDQKVSRTKGPVLYARSGVRKGQRVPVSAQGLTIGRSRVNQLQLNERSVSRRHATIWKTKQGYFIRDDNSSLGTIVNGKRIIRPQRLRHGDVIRIGYYEYFEFRVKS